MFKDINRYPELEKEYIRVEKHVFWFISNVLTIIIGYIFLLIAMFLFFGFLLDAQVPLLYLIVSGIFIIAILSSYWMWITAQYYIRTGEALVVRGFIPKKTIIKYTPDINVTLAQTLMGKLFKYEKIIFESRLGDPNQEMAYVKNAQEVIDVLMGRKKIDDADLVAMANAADASAENFDAQSSENIGLEGIEFEGFSDGPGN